MSGSRPATDHRVPTKTGCELAGRRANYTKTHGQLSGAHSAVLCVGKCITEDLICSTASARDEVPTGERTMFLLAAFKEAFSFHVQSPRKPLTSSDPLLFSLQVNSFHWARLSTSSAFQFHFAVRSLLNRTYLCNQVLHIPQYTIRSTRLPTQQRGLRGVRRNRYRPCAAAVSSPIPFLFWPPHHWTAGAPVL